MIRDDKAFERKGPIERSCILGCAEENVKRKPREGMPQVKGLKKLIVAGLAAKDRDMAEHRSNSVCILWLLPYLF